MAKRKRAEQLEILNETAEAYHAAKRARPAPQAAPHRRGGTHGVKDEHMTGSKWDQVDRKGLLEALKARRNRGIWKKDLPKHEMARRLAEDDRRQELATRRLEQETIERVNELKKRKAKEIEEKARRKAEKQKRRDYGEDVSSDSEDRPQENQFGVGEILSDSSLDKLSESTTITSPTLIPPMYPHERLRIFEWSHAEPPSEDPPEEIFSPSGRERENVEEELVPTTLPYTVMKLITTLTGETLELPGRQYPEEIGQDFVPKLSQYMMNCARNGIMVGALRKAVIEPAQDWAQRTHVQYWNGRMYLELPGRTSTLSLPEVFTKWEHKKKAQRYVPKGTIVKRKTRAEKLQHHKREKKQKMFDIFASSEYRPPICYAPVDLDYPNVYTDDEGPRELDNLYYVRFPGMDLPHYYFWTRRYEWADPTVPNPNWMSAKIQDEALEREEELQRGKELNEEANRPHVRPGYKEDTSRPYILKTSKMRAKKTSTPCKFQPGQKRLPKTSKFKAALWAVERELYQNGLQTVLYKYRDAWMDEGKEQTWRLLSENLPKLYPSGRMPEAPPVHEDDVPSSVAEKIASMEAPNPSRPVSPLRGDEPWTRDDDEYWNVVDAPPRRVSEADIQRELLRSMSVVGRRYPRRQSALYRRASEGLYGTTDEYAPGLTGWLHGTSPSYTSSQWEDDNLPSNDSIGYREYERLLWEHRFEAFAAENTTLDGEQDLRTAYMLRRGSSNPPLPAHLDAMPISELKWKISNLRNPSLDHGEQCRLCLEPLDKTDVTSVYEHYQKHHDDSSHRCPFCDMTWGKLDSTWKASHVLSHDFDDSIHRRRLSSVKPSVYYSIPVPNRTTSQRLSQIAARSSKRRPSKVSFSPKIVEKRIAYNDQDEDEGVDADVDTLPPTSPGPRRSSLKFRNASGTPSNRSSKGLARKSSLKVNTSVAKPGVAKMATGAKLLKPTAEHKVQPTNPNGNRGKDTRPVDSWTILHSLPMPSDLTPSPEVMPVSKRRRGEADPTWDPRGQSPSDHIKSPYLPHVVHYSRDHPDGTYNPRRWSKSTAETLEYHTGGRKPKPKKAAMKATSHTTRSKTRSAGKGKAKQIDEEELPSTSSSRALKRSYSDFEYTQPAPSTKPSSYHRPKYRKVKTKTIDTTYQDIAPSSPSSGSKSPVLYKRKKAADATYRNISDSESTTTAHSTKKVKKTTKTPRGRKPGSTLQNAKLKEQDVASKASSSRRKKASSGANPAKSSKPMSTSSQTKKRKASSCSASALWRKPSLLNADDSTDWHDQDFIRFIDTDLLDDYDQDVVMENPFAPPPKKKRKTATVTSKAKSKTKAKAKVKSGSDRRVTVPATPPTPSLATRHATRKSTSHGTTISGRPFIEPIPLAPAKRVGKNKPVRRPSISMTETPTTPTPQTSAMEVDISSSFNSIPDAESTSAISKSRGRRSSAPTPSPSLSLSLHMPRTSSVSTTTSALRTNVNRTGRRGSNATISTSLPSPTPRTKATSRSSLHKLITNPRPATHRSSYDTPSSDARPIVPPNTPAPATLRTRRASRTRARARRLSEPAVGVAEAEAEAEADGDIQNALASTLDINVLSDKIGKVKTTRGGLVRELPETVVRSVLGRGKPRGRSVSKQGEGGGVVHKPLPITKETRGEGDVPSDGQVGKGKEKRAVKKGKARSKPNPTPHPLPAPTKRALHPPSLAQLAKGTPAQAQPQPRSRARPQAQTDVDVKAKAKATGMTPTTRTTSRAAKDKLATTRTDTRLGSGAAPAGAARRASARLQGKRVV